MAITQCKECNKEVSTRAEKCPHCGARLKMNPDDKLKATAVLVVLALVVGSFVFNGDDDSESSSTADQPQAEESSGPPEDWVALDKSDEMQTRRLELIEDLREQGVFTKVEVVKETPFIYVGSVWDSITVDDKRNFANAALTYFYAKNSDANMAVILDGYTGKDIGQFSLQYGLMLD